jgi:hypothetical protein
LCHSLLIKMSVYLISISLAFESVDVILQWVDDVLMQWYNYTGVFILVIDEKTFFFLSYAFRSMTSIWPNT